MSSRLYVPEDAASVDELLAGSGHVVDLTRDHVVVTSDVHNRVSGVLVGRPALWVHELRLSPGNFARKRADHLVLRGLHLLRGCGYRDVLFMVDRDNASMLRFVPDLPYNAVEQPPARIFWMKLPPLASLVDRAL